MLSLLLYSSGFAAISSGNIADVVRGPWVGSGKSTTIGVALAKNMKYVKGVFGWSGIAFMVASVAAEYIPVVQEKWFNWIGLQQTGVRLNGDNIQVLVNTGNYRFSDEVEAGLTAWIAGQTGTVHLIGRYSTYESAYQACQAYRTANGITSDLVQVNFSGGSMWKLQVGMFSSAQIYIFPFSNTLEEVKEWQNVSSSNVGVLRDILEDDLSGANGEKKQNAAKKIWEEVERLLQEKLQDGRENGLSEDALDSYKQKLYDELTQAQKDALEEAEEDPAEEPTEQANDLISMVNYLYSKIKDLLGLNDEAPDQTDLQYDEGENDSILSPGEIEQAKEDQLEETDSILDGLWNVTSGLRDDLNAKMQGLIVGGGGLCSLSFEVFGSTHYFDFCGIDLTAFRTVVIAVGIVAAMMIVIL